MAHQNSDRLKGHGTVNLVGDDRFLQWEVFDAQGKHLGNVGCVDDPSVDEYAQALALLGLKRPFELNKALSSIQIRETWDDHSPWGSAMQALGVLCDVASVLGGKIPESAGYRPAMGLNTVDDLDMSEETGDAATLYLISDIQTGLVSLHDVELAIRILDRYLDLPEVAAGRY